MPSPPPRGKLEVVATFSSEDAIETYWEHAATDGLFEPERDIFDRYFTRFGARVLDVGCGAGRTTVELAEHSEPVLLGHRRSPSRRVHRVIGDGKPGPYASVSYPIQPPCLLFPTVFATPGRRRVLPVTLTRRPVCHDSSASTNRAFVETHFSTKLQVTMCGPSETTDAVGMPQSTTTTTTTTTTTYPSLGSLTTL